MKTPELAAPGAPWLNGLTLTLVKEAGQGTPVARCGWTRGTTEGQCGALLAHRWDTRVGPVLCVERHGVTGLEKFVHALRSGGKAPSRRHWDAWVVRTEPWFWLASCSKCGHLTVAFHAPSCCERCGSVENIAPRELSHPPPSHLSPRCPQCGREPTEPAEVKTLLSPGLRSPIPLR